MNVPNPLAVMRVNAGFTSAAAAAEKMVVTVTKKKKGKVVSTYQKNITVNHIYNVERGRCGASEDFIEAMAKAYGVSADTVRGAIAKARRQLLKRQLSDA